MIENFFWTLVGAAVSWFFFHISAKTAKEENKRLTAELKLIQEASSKITTFTGLDEFERRLLKLIETAGRSVRLMVTTPLIGSLRKEEEGNTWWKEFCEPLIKGLKERENNKKLQMHLINLSDEGLKFRLLKTKYKDSKQIDKYMKLKDKFLNEIKNNCGKARNFTNYQVEIEQLRFHMCIVDAETGKKGVAKAIIALVNIEKIIKETEEIRTYNENDDIFCSLAKELICFEITDPGVVKFFKSLFDIVEDSSTHSQSVQNLISYLGKEVSLSLIVSKDKNHKSSISCDKLAKMIKNKELDELLIRKKVRET